MKLIIDINEIAYKNATHIPSIDWNGNLLRIVNDALHNGTPIPDNATNGDVIKAMFPKDVKVITQHDDIFGRRFIDLRVGQLDCELDDEWWNAPYQKGGK